MSSEELEKNLELSAARLAEIADLMNAAQKEKEENNREITAQHRILNELNSKDLRIRNKLGDYMHEMNKIKRQIENEQREIAREKENERVKLKFARQMHEYAELASQYAWGQGIELQGKTVKAMGYQLDGAIKGAVADHGFVLGDKPGLGKTLTSIIYTDLTKAKKILAIVPAEVMGNYQREIQLWGPHRSPHVIGGLAKLARKPLLMFFKSIDEIFVIVNYEAWRKDLALLDQLIDVQFDTVIADEAHMIKDMGSIAFRGVEKIVKAENACPQCGSTYEAWGMKYINYQNTRVCNSCGYVQQRFGDFRSVKRFVPMTGTPVLNAPADFFPLLHLVNEQLFPDRAKYLRDFCEKDIYTNKWKFQPGGEERLAARISAFYVARDRDQAGIKLPPQEVQVHNLELDPKEYPRQWQAYKDLSEGARIVMDDLLSDEGNKGVIPIFYKIALITRQRQMMTWPAGIKLVHPKTKQTLFQTDVTESVKIDWLIDRYGKEGNVKRIVEDEGDRVVVFSQFKEPLIEVERRLKLAGIKVVRYDGDTSKELRQEIQIDFDRKHQSEDKPYRWDVVLCNYKSGGVGLNLNAATQTVILDEEWNPGKVKQAYGRTDRLGQTEETIVHVLRVKASIDTWLHSVIEAKAKMIQGLDTQLDIEQELLDILRGVKPAGASDE